jgi:photosystem II stability/assembly factor-like uncharacterized protein
MQLRRSALLVLMIIFFIYFEIHSCSEDTLLAPDVSESTADNLIYRPMDVFFQDENLGWVAGSAGTIMKTTDGGESWVGAVVDSGDFRDIQFIDMQDGWLAGKDGAFYRTFDGGASWKRVVSYGYPIDEDFSHVHFMGAALGFVQGVLGIYRTEDGGMEWNNYWLPFIPYKGAWGMSFVSESAGYLLGTKWMEPDPVLLYRTSDGGRTWQDVSGSRASVLSSIITIAFVNEQTGWAGGGVIMKTSDGGETWETQRESTTVRKFFFIDEQCGFAAGGTMILKTVDGGITWTDVSPNDERVVDLRGIYFFDENSGWVIGFGNEVTDGSRVYMNSVILQTEDSGASWTLREFSYELDQALLATDRTLFE